MANFVEIQTKWQKLWELKKAFKASEASKKPKFYCLEMYPYPSASFLHMGHVRNFTIGDVYARFKRMNGFNVLYPMGFDSFGLPAEIAAKKEGTHPRIYTEKAISKIMEYFKALGNSYDWDRTLSSHDPAYYRWNQYFFLKLYEKGLAYRKKAPVNWCEKCQSVLANEEAEGGKCWRCEEEVTKKDMEQWFFKITEYADRLLKDLDKIDWPERIKIMQKNWIGRKEWIDIDYEILGTNKKITVSTTRPDTNFGATFVVIAPEHPLLSTKENLVPEKYRKAVDAYIEKALRKTEEERIEEGTKKTGVFTGLYCINQLTNKKMPIWVTDFVLLSVGTGAVVGVPGHDLRDFEFAKEYDLPIIRVVVGSDGDRSEITKKEQVQEEEGIIINSGFLDGLDIHKATKKIMDYLEEKGQGRRAIRYRLRDWLISRQRYWGTPIPIIYCDKCGIVPVPEKDLPVLLPEEVDFQSRINPLLSNKGFVDVKCPKCKANAKRETDTMGGFVDSSWYFLRYCDNNNKKKPFDKEKTGYWMPVDQYIGGAEHAVMHLIYARFFIKALKDMGFVDFDEPFFRLFNQGIIYKDGAKMSKSKGNVVFQTDISNKYGIDTARLFLMFVASPDKQMEWSDAGVEGSFRFLNKVYDLLEHKSSSNVKDRVVIDLMHRTIRDVTENIDKFQYNLAIIGLMKYANYLSKYKESIGDKVYNEALEKVVLLVSPFAPHLAEEMWNTLRKKDFVSLADWPKFDSKKIDDKIEAEETLVNKVIEDAKEIMKLIKIKPQKVKILISEKWKYPLFKKLQKEIKKDLDFGRIVKSVIVDGHEKETAKLVQSIIKDTKKVSSYVLGQESEFKVLNESLKEIKKELSLDAEIIKAESSKEEKARQALPGKPAIIME